MMAAFELAPWQQDNSSCYNFLLDNGAYMIKASLGDQAAEAEQQ